MSKEQHSKCYMKAALSSLERCAQVSRLDWNCQGKRLATGSIDQIIRVWNVELAVPGRDKREAELAYGREPNEILWHPTHPDQLASSAADNLIKLWDMRTSKVAYTTKLKRNGYMYLAWNPARPDILAAVSQESEIAFMDARSQKVLATLPSVKEVNEVRFSKDGRLFFRTMHDGSVEIFSYPELVKLHTLEGHAAKVHCLDLTQSNQTLVTGGEDATVTFFDLETLTATKSLWVLDSTVKAVRFSFDGQHLAYCCQDERAIHIENCQKGEQSALLTTPDVVKALKWNPKHNVLAFTGSHYDGGRMASNRSFGNFCVYAPKIAA